MNRELKEQFKNLNQEGFVLVGSIFLVAFLGILIATAFLRSNIQLKESDLRIASQESFYAAESGIEAALRSIRQNPGWQGGSQTLNVTINSAAVSIGSYTVTTKDGELSQNLPTVWVRSEGSSATSTLMGGIVKRVIIAQIAVFSPTQFFASTLGDLTIGSGSNYDDDILARDVNFKIFAANNPIGINVDGIVYYMRDLNGESDPNVTIGGSEAAPPFTFPGVNLSDFRTLADSAGVVLPDATPLSGNIDPAALGASNGLIYVEGDLFISGSFSSAVTIVAEGDIYIDGDIVRSGAQATSQLALLAAQDVIISATAGDTLQVEAFIMADGQDRPGDSSDGVFKTAANPATRTQLILTGAISVRGGGSGSAIELNAYSNRTYTYNTQLTNGLLNLLPNIANILQWREAFPPTDVLPN